MLTTRQGGRDNTNSDFFGAGDVGINVYSYMPKYLLLNVTPNGFQIGGGTENEAQFKTKTYQSVPSAISENPPARRRSASCRTASARVADRRSCT